MPVILEGFDLTIRNVSVCIRYALFHYLLPLFLLLWPDYVVRMKEYFKWNHIASVILVYLSCVFIACDPLKQ